MAQDPVGISVKEDLLRRTEAAFERLTQTVRGIEGLQPSSDGGWGAFEVLSHLTGWHLLSARRLGQIARGEEVSTPPADDEANAAFVAERHQLSPAALLADLVRSFAAVREAVRLVPEAEFWRSDAGEEDSLAYFVAAANTFDHYSEHEEELATP